MTDTSQSTQVGDAIDIRELAADARSLSREEFEDRHGSGYLLLTASQLADPQGPAPTVLQLAREDGLAERTAAVTTLVYSVRRTGRAVGPFVTLGRTPNNDVVLPDRSVSRFHAFIKRGSQGMPGFEIQDAGSTNGTHINSSEVPAQGTGAAVALKDGDTVRVGQVELTYLGIGALRDYVLLLER